MQVEVALAAEVAAPVAAARSLAADQEGSDALQLSEPESDLQMERQAGTVSREAQPEGCPSPEFRTMAGALVHISAEDEARGFAPGLAERTQVPAGGLCYSALRARQAYNPFYSP